MNYLRLNRLIKLGREFGHEQIRDAGFSDTEHSICTFLSFHDHVSQDSIAKALMQDKTTVAKGLISRMPNDRNRRENIIRITDDGKASVKNSIDVYETWLEKVCSCLSEEELRQMDGYFDRIVDHAMKIRSENKTI